MRIKYTVYTKHCPYCNYTLEEDWHEALSPFYGICMLVLFPVFISYWLIRRFGFGDPDIPKIGDEVISCPNCSLPIRTDKVALIDLTDKEFLIYRFRAWFIVSYVIGGVFTISTLNMIVTGIPVASWWGLTSLLSLLGVGAIIATYRVKLRDVQ